MGREGHPDKKCPGKESSGLGLTGLHGPVRTGKDVSARQPFAWTVEK